MKLLSYCNFDSLFRVLLVLLPFITVLTVFTREKLGIGGFSFLKEFLLMSMLMIVVWYHVTGKKKIVWTRYDIAIWVYMLILMIVSAFTTGLIGIVYGGRYDFSFLVAFFVLYHGFFLLEKPVSYYIRIFLISWGIMICISMLLKWPFSEDLLLYLGYSGNPSNWQFGSSLPIFHGVDGANVRRFQGLLDGPNTMGAFLLLYIGMWAYYLRQKKDWYFLIGCGVLGFMVLIFFTYSRSAVLWLFLWVGIIILFLLRYLFTHYKKQLFSLMLIAVFVIVSVFIQYAGNMQALIGRSGSTSGHLERMTLWVERFMSHPFGQGLWSAWPAYRYVEKLEWVERMKIEEMDRFFIPESWYIQQLIEGWLLWFLSFMTIILFLLFGLYKVHILLVGMFVSICTMNLFLHTFESSVVSLSLFILIAIILAYDAKKHTKL